MAKNKNNSNSIRGLEIAAHFGFRPHYLGLCGPKEAVRQRLLEKFLKGKIPPTRIKQVFRGFQAAYPYYRLIAKSNKIKNPFDEKVVAAYWIGNKLLDRVKTGDLREMVSRDFSGPGLLPEKIAKKKAAAVPGGSKPHHSFHVLVIGSVTGSVDFKNTKLKDLCRVGWGKIIKIPNSKSQIPNLIVEYQPLVGEKKIKLGHLVKKEIIWNKLLVPKVKIGDWAAFHWDYLSQILTPQDLQNLKKSTLNTLNAWRR